MVNALLNNKTDKTGNCMILSVITNQYKKKWKTTEKKKGKTKLTYPKTVFVQSNEKS